MKTLIFFSILSIILLTSCSEKGNENNDLRYFSLKGRVNTVCVSSYQGSIYQRKSALYVFNKSGFLEKASDFWGPDDTDLSSPSLVIEFFYDKDMKLVDVLYNGKCLEDVFESISRRNKYEYKKICMESLPNDPYLFLNTEGNKQYKYDNKGNWIEMTIKHEITGSTIVKRKIAYY